MIRSLAAAGVWIVLLIFLVAGSCPASAQSRLAEFLHDVPAGELVPGADRYAAPQGSPPVAQVLSGDRLVGYAFVNADWVNSTGYSGKPIQILVGLGTDGKIAGARLMDHHEPIILIGIPPARIAAFIHGYVGRDVLQLATNSEGARPAVDIVSGATVTVSVIADSMMRSGLRVARAEGIGGKAAAAAPVQRELDPNAVAPEDWTGLLGDGSVRRLHLSVGEVNEAFARSGNQEGANHPQIARPRRHVHRPLRRAGQRAGDRPPPARRRRLRCAPAEPEARTAGDPGRRRRPLLVQGDGLRARRDVRPHRGAAGRYRHPVPRPQPQARRRHRGARAPPACTTWTCSRRRPAPRSTSPGRGASSCWCSGRSGLAARSF